MTVTATGSEVLKPAVAEVVLAAEVIARFEFDAITKEFDGLRAEVNSRIQKQQEITNFAIALMVGFAAFSRFLLDGKTVVLSGIQSVYPAVSILFSAFALMTLDHESNIADIYRYTDTELRPRVQHMLTNDRGIVWRWNERRACWQNHSGVTNIFYYAMSWSKYAITALPAIGLMMIYCRARGFSGSPWEHVLFLVAITFICVLLACATFVGLQYHRMGRLRHSDSAEAESL